MLKILKLKFKFGHYMLLMLVEVVTFADVDAEDHVGNSLLIWELTFGHKTNLLFRL